MFLVVVGDYSTLNRLTRTCKSIKLTWNMWKTLLLQWQSWGVKEKKGSDCWKKRGLLVKKMAQNTTWEKWERERKRDSLSLPSLWYDKFMHGSCVCQSRPGVFVGQFLREEGEGREKGGKSKKAKRGERAETLSSNSRKWVDPDRVRLCSLCGFNESTVFRTRRGTRELA